ncbi:branched-chain amino acid ABC transporter permease [Geoglobus acetivorans]|uniref:High-affinity branched-chain amino acid transport system permease protein LivH n=1 Tax=Geoglobus acetivorans TaxID=565033 RepID=A0A0A7GED8_GEOAI|nr:High-affinity branched-chain amino acid transport system permease protein LivH [Geoglobus acetivorans]
MVGDHLISNLFYGALLGSVYGVATMGLSMIFGVLRIVNVGHGSFVMVGAFTAFWLFTLYSIAPILSIPVALIFGIALGFVIFRAVMKKLVDAPELSTLLATFAIGVFIEESAKFIWGSDYVGFSWDIGTLYLGSITVPYTKILAFVASTIIAGLLYLWFTKTKLGKAIKAVVEDRDGAAVCGIDVNRIFTLSFALGIGVTVMSGVLVTLFVPVGINVYMGADYTLRAFVIAVLGGLGSPWGAFIAGFLFGLFENGSYTLLGMIPGVEPFALTRFVAFVFLLVILLVKPTGLFGGEE